MKTIKKFYFINTLIYILAVLSVMVLTSFAVIQETEKFTDSDYQSEGIDEGDIMQPIKF